VSLSVRRLEDAIGIALFTAMLVVVLAQVVVRFLLYRWVQIAWADEIGRALLVWSSFWGAVLVTRESRHITVDLLYDRLPSRARWLLRVLGDLAMGGFLLVVIARGLPIFLDSLVRSSPATDLPFVIFVKGARRAGRPRWPRVSTTLPSGVSFNHPADVAVAPNGDIYVADGYGNSSVHRFTAEGKHLGTWGGPGLGRGQFTTPHGIWVDARERVYVADRENNRVQLFSPEGDFCGEWGDVYHPMDIYIDPAGTVYVTDQIPRITMFSPEGKMLARGRPVDAGAHGLWGDSKGDLYLAEMRLTQVTKLVRRPPARAGSGSQQGRGQPP
jgi:TRAP-type C4-dicarboxylate transport system permease small subunit